ncbi:hypothetical protein APT_02421 [Acetobacter pasteurianus NBRC 101655]|nr:hypothetical protein APT_02421 [Acetobacter pasteurianus NBRC 101655]GAB31308.1 hypothetical protein APS_1910 [Acetobacter pasteurianus subsp. pasteurianus LMG 1262 = NBRC 106471]CCT59322.1 hypothetical protein APA386B_1227 [Acetobacter pasteurianus 386B]
MKESIGAHARRLAKKAGTHCNLTDTSAQHEAPDYTIRCPFCAFA